MIMEMSIMIMEKITKIMEMVTVIIEMSMMMSMMMIMEKMMIMEMVTKIVKMITEDLRKMGKVRAMTGLFPTASLYQPQCCHYTAPFRKPRPTFLQFSLCHPTVSFNC